MIVVAEAVAAIAAAIAIWLMSRARFGCPLVSMVVNVTFGRGRSSCVIRGDRRGCSRISSSAEQRSGLRWMAGTLPGVLFLVFCTCRLYKVPLGRWVSCCHNGRTVGHPLKFHSFRLWGGWLAIGHPSFSRGSWWRDQCVKVSAEQF